jgi:hypothetical protein
VTLLAMRSNAYRRLSVQCRQPEGGRSMPLGFGEPSAAIEGRS